MPGLFGIWRRDPVKDPEEISRILSGQAASMCRHSEYLINSRVLDHRCGVGRVHLGILDQEEQPVLSSDGRYALCLDGEFYDRDALSRQFLGQEKWSHSDASLALALYQQAGWSWLREVNGQFALALYDRQTQRLYLVTDRFGLRPIYYYEDGRGVLFGAEVKAIISDTAVPRKIDPLAVQEFFTFGYLLEDRTWIQGVRLLPSASITTIDSSGTKVNKYWSWDEIQPLPDSLTLDEAAEELGRLWIQAVRRRVDEKRIGLTLSGGLDSRAVLAAIPEDYHPLHVVTFGIPGCDDHRFAAQAAAVKGAIHHFVPISESEWLAPRLDAVWWTDGHLNLMHMHGIEAAEKCRGFFDIGLNGMLGDGTIGGTHLFSLDEAHAYVHQCIIPASRALGMEIEEASRRYLSLILRLGNAHALYCEQRNRRFVMNGLLIYRSFLEARMPFTDVPLQTFIYSVPLRFRTNYLLYKAWVIRYYPQFFERIPWQKTGLPISAGKLRHQLHHFIRRVESKVRHGVAKIGIYFPDRHNYVDYNLWTRVEPARTFICKTLLNKDALWQEFLPKDKCWRLVQDHLEGKRLDAEGVLLLLTFEIYLQRLNS